MTAHSKHHRPPNAWVRGLVIAAGCVALALAFGGALRIARTAGQFRRGGADPGLETSLAPGEVRPELLPGLPLRAKPVPGKVRHAVDAGMARPPESHPAPTPEPIANNPQLVAAPALAASPEAATPADPLQLIHRLRQLP